MSNGTYSGRNIDVAVQNAAKALGVDLDSATRSEGGKIGLVEFHFDFTKSRAAHHSNDWLGFSAGAGLHRLRDALEFAPRRIVILLAPFVAMASERLEAVVLDVEAIHVLSEA